MTIHFSPYFDGGAYVDLPGRGGIFFNEKTAGPLGLLGELEERLGFAGDTDGELRRLVLYVKAMRETVTASPT